MATSLHQEEFHNAKTASDPVPVICMNLSPHSVHCARVPSVIHALCPFGISMLFMRHHQGLKYVLIWIREGRTPRFLLCLHIFGISPIAFSTLQIILSPCFFLFLFFRYSNKIDSAIQSSSKVLCDNKSQK